LKSGPQSAGNKDATGGHSRALPYAAAFLVTVLWSSSYVLIKWELSEIPPLYFATLRYALAFLVLLGVDAAASRRDPRGQPSWKKPTLLLIAIGISGYTVAQGLQFVGLYYLPAVTTSLLLNFTPFFVLVIGWALIGESASLAQLAGLILAVIGAYLFFSEGMTWGGNWLGVAIVVVSGVGWAFYVVLVRVVHRSGAIGPLRLTTVTMGVGVAGMAVLTAATGEYAPLTSAGVATIVWLATVNTALAFFLWNWVLKSIPAYELSVLQDLMLVEIALLSVVFLQETLTFVMVGGMGLVLVGVLVVQMGRKSDASSPPATSTGTATRERTASPSDQTPPRAPAELPPGGAPLYPVAHRPSPTGEAF